jgi:large-conductance mechanosensitive channel
LTVLASSSTPAAGQVVTGVLGFLVVAGMGVALFFLLRSMNKHLRKVMREPRWREDAGGQPGGGGDGPQDEPEPDYSRNGSGQA